MKKAYESLMSLLTTNQGYPWCPLTLNQEYEWTAEGVVGSPSLSS